MRCKDLQKRRIDSKAGVSHFNLLLPFLDASLLSMFAYARWVNQFYSHYAYGPS